MSKLKQAIEKLKEKNKETARLVKELKETKPDQGHRFNPNVPTLTTHNPHPGRTQSRGTADEQDLRNFRGELAGLYDAK